MSVHPYALTKKNKITQHIHKKPHLKTIYANKPKLSMLWLKTRCI